MTYPLAGAWRCHEAFEIRIQWYTAYKKASKAYRTMRSSIRQSVAYQTALIQNNAAFTRTSDGFYWTVMLRLPDSMGLSGPPSSGKIERLSDRLIDGSIPYESFVQRAHEES